ncbi:MAG: ABC transporter permease/substrate-binding protein [Halioglobus sp.]
MSEALYEQLILMPDYFRGHLLLTIAAMSGSIAISIPLGIWAAQSPRVKQPLLAVVSIVQTFPSLAILALMVALLGGKIGFLPAFLALTMYSMLPIVRNTVTGLESIPPDIVEAARGIGMTSRQILLKVRLPLALPIIIAGIRTAMVWTVGLATLSTLVGATSFGNYIFTGIQTRNLLAITVGSLASALMAVTLDAIIGGIQWLAENDETTATKQKVKLTKRLLSGATLALVAITVVTFLPKPKPDFIIGSKAFTEQYILAGLLAETLTQAGFRVEKRTGLGSDIAFDATRTGNIDLYMEYSGTLWANHMDKEGNPGREAIREQTMAYVDEQGMVSVGPSGFQNLYAFAMRRDRAEELGIKTIEDLVPVASQLVCGGDLEFFGRPEWIRVRDLYSLDFDKKLTFDAALMYNAVNDRQVDLITAYSTDGRVAAYDLVIIEDPRNALLPYDGLYLASKKAAATPGFIEAMAPLVNGIPDEVMREANKVVDVDGRSISEAVDVLLEHIAGENAD